MFVRVLILEHWAPHQSEAPSHQSTVRKNSDLKILGTASVRVSIRVFGARRSSACFIGRQQPEASSHQSVRQTSAFEILGAPSVLDSGEDNESIKLEQRSKTRPRKGPAYVLPWFSKAAGFATRKQAEQGPAEV